MSKLTKISQTIKKKLKENLKLELVKKLLMIKMVIEH